MDTISSPRVSPDERYDCPAMSQRKINADMGIFPKKQKCIIDYCSDTLLPCDCCYVTAEHYKPSSKRSETSSSFAKVTLVLSLGSSLCFFVVSRDDLLLPSISSVSYLQTSWLSRYLSVFSIPLDTFWQG